MKLLVTGAGGLLGRACVSVASEKHECVGLTRQELDVTDRRAVASAVRRVRPEAVLHCAAYTDVDGAERDFDRAMSVNAEAAEWVARSARDHGARVVYVSTDYVFDGEKSTPYTESDRPRPLSRYGVSKLDGERRVTEICPDTGLIVRTGWLYGAGKGFVDWFLRQLDEGARPKLVDDQVGSPTWAVHLAAAILLLAEESHSGTFHFVNRGATHWLGVGRAILECLGAEAANLERATLADWVRPAPRPRYCALDVGKFEAETDSRVTPWNEALALYLSSVGPVPRRRAAQPE